jgi:hypothetical protein
MPDKIRLKNGTEAYEQDVEKMIVALKRILDNNAREFLDILEFAEEKQLFISDETKNFHSRKDVKQDNILKLGTNVLLSMTLNDHGRLKQKIIKKIETGKPEYIKLPNPQEPKLISFLRSIIKNLRLT